MGAVMRFIAEKKWSNLRKENVINGKNTYEGTPMGGGTH